MKVSLIVAMADNRVIGRNNELPWHLPNDLQYFKSVTMSKPLLMGRKTFESIGRPLPGRRNIVVSANADWSHDGVETVSSIDQGIRLAADEDSTTELMVMGGGQIYQQTLPMADRLYITHVKAEVDGDAWFPEVDWSQWREDERQDYPACAKNPYDYSFVVYDRFS